AAEAARGGAVGLADALGHDQGLARIGKVRADGWRDIDLERCAARRIVLHITAPRLAWPIRADLVNIVISGRPPDRYGERRHAPWIAREAELLEVDGRRRAPVAAGACDVCRNRRGIDERTVMIE